MEKWNSQLGHGQPLEQRRGLFCTCNSGMAHCQSQHQYHFCLIGCSKCIAWANENGSCQSNLCHSLGYEWCKNLKIHKRIASKM